MKIKEDKMQKKTVTLLLGVVYLLCCSNLLVYSAQEISDKEDNSQELNGLDNYLITAKNLYKELNDKFIWAKKENIVPAKESRLISKDLINGKLNSDFELDKAFSKLPWGGWSRQWSKRLALARETLDPVTPISRNGIEMKMQIQTVLNSLIWLRSDYESILDGKESNPNSLINQIEGAIKAAERDLSYSKLIQEEGNKEKALSGDQNKQSLRKEYNSLPESKITIDLIKGTINNIDIRDSLTQGQLVSFMGKQPEDKEYNVYSYYSDGIEVTFNEKTKKCSNINIFLKNVKVDEFLGGGSWSYQPFKYRVLPIDGQENVKLAIDKLGPPKSYDASTIDGSPRLRYDTSYGSMSIFFGKDEKIDETQLLFFYPEKE